MNKRTSAPEAIAFGVSLSRLQRPSSSGHKPAQLRDQDRFANPSYAFRSLTGAFAFPIPEKEKGAEIW